MKKKLSIIALALVMLVCSIPIMPVTATDTVEVSTITEDFNDETLEDCLTWGSLDDRTDTSKYYTKEGTDKCIGPVIGSGVAINTNYLSVSMKNGDQRLLKVEGETYSGDGRYYGAAYQQIDGAYSGVTFAGFNESLASTAENRYKFSLPSLESESNTWTSGAANTAYKAITITEGYETDTNNFKSKATWIHFALEYDYSNNQVTLTVQDLNKSVWTCTQTYSADMDALVCMLAVVGNATGAETNAPKIDNLTMTYEGTSTDTEPEPEPEVSSTVTEDFNDGALESYLQWVSLDGRTDTSNYYTKDGTDKCFGPKNEGTSVAINTNYLSVAMENNGQRLLKVEGELYSGDGRTWGIAYQQTDGTYTGVGLDGFKEDKTGDDRYRFRLSDLASSNNAWTSSNTGYKETTISDGYAGQADLFKSKTTWISFSFEYDYANSQVILTVQDLAKQVWTCTQTYSADMNTLVCMLAVLGNKTGSDANIPKIDNLVMTYEGTSTETESDIKVSINGPTLPTYTENMTIGYQCSVSGSDIVELGMLVTLKQFVTDGKITTANLNVTDAENNAQYIKKACINDATTISSIVEKGIFYANVGSISPDYYGARYIVRVYAKDSAGTVYYSTSTEDASKGLSGDGYAENSVISVVKEYLEFCIENQVAGIGDVASLKNGVLTYTDAYHPSTDGGQKLIEWLSSKSTDIANKVAEVKATTEQ